LNDQEHAAVLAYLNTNLGKGAAPAAAAPAQGARGSGRAGACDAARGRQAQLRPQPSGSSSRPSTRRGAAQRIGVGERRRQQVRRHVLVADRAQEPPIASDPTEVMRASDVAGNGPPWTMAWQTSTPVPKPLNRIRPPCAPGAAAACAAAAWSPATAWTETVSWPSRLSTTAVRARCPGSGRSEAAPNTSSCSERSRRNASAVVGEQRRLAPEALAALPLGDGRHEVVGAQGGDALDVGLVDAGGQHGGGGGGAHRPRRPALERRQPGTVEREHQAGLVQNCPAPRVSEATKASPIASPRAARRLRQEDDRIDRAHLGVDRDRLRPRLGDLHERQARAPRAGEAHRLDPPVGDQGLADGPAGIEQQREHAGRQAAARHRLLDGAAGDLRRPRVRECALTITGQPAAQRRGGVAAGHRERQREVAGPEHRHGPQRHVAQAQSGRGGVRPGIARSMRTSR
jgi:hypothetical protein